MSVRARLAYLATTLLAAAAGTAATALAGGPAAAVGAGSGLAWAVQAPAVWLLGAGLARGERVTGRWAAGLAARVAGIAPAALAAPALGVSRGGAIAAYGAAMVAFLLMEAGWLWRTSSAPPGDPTRRTDPERADPPRGAESVGGSRFT